MREGWEIKTIAESTQIVAGGTPKTDIKEFWDGNIAWITPADLGKLTTREVDITKRTITNVGLQKSSAKLFPAYSVVLSSRAPIGHLAINTIPMATNQGCRGIVPNKNLDNTYLYYFIKNNIKLLNELGTGTTFKELSTKALGSVKIPIPPLEEQKQIVAILDQAFEAIDQAKANIEKNIANAKELFQSKLNAIFSQKGDGWEEKSLGEIADVNYGYTDKSTSEGDFRYIRITDIDNNGELDKTGKVYIKSTSESLNFILKENDLLMARTGATFAKVLLYKDDEPSIFASYLIKISFKVDIINELYWYFTKSGYYWEQANNLSSGSAQPHFNGAALKKVKFSYPIDTEKQKELNEIIKGFDITSKEIVSLYKQKLNNLEELKKSILQKAFAGALTNREVVLQQVAEPIETYLKN